MNLKDMESLIMQMGISMTGKIFIFLKNCLGTGKMERKMDKEN